MESALLADRLVATLTGAAIVIAGNVVFDRVLGASAPPARATPRRPN